MLFCAHRTILCCCGSLALGPFAIPGAASLSDARHLVVRLDISARPRLVLAAGIPLVICGLGVGMPAGLAALAGVLVSDGALWRRCIGLLVARSLWGYAAHSFYPHELWLAHLHNPIGVLICFVVTTDERLHLIPLCCMWRVRR